MMDILNLIFLIRFPNIFIQPIKAPSTFDTRHLLDFVSILCFIPARHKSFLLNMYQKRCIYEHIEKIYYICEIKALRNI